MEEENEYLRQKIQQQEVIIDDLSNPLNTSIESIPLDEEGYKKSL